MAPGTDNLEPGDEDRRRGKEENDEVFDPEQHRFDPSLNETQPGGDSTSEDLKRTQIRPGGQTEESGPEAGGIAGSGYTGPEGGGEPRGGTAGPGEGAGESTQRLGSAYHDAYRGDYSATRPANYGQGHPPAGYTPAWQTPVAEAPEPKRRRFTIGRLFRDVVVPLVIAFAIAMFVQATVAKPYKIPSGSMLPTIKLGDRILADRLIYHFKDIQRGDIIVFDPPTQQTGAEPGVPFVKRVVGLPGDTVQVIKGKTLINGEEFVVPQADRPAYTRKAEVVPDGMLFVLGDNRNESSDSHIWGYVPIENVIGRVELIYWPIGHMDFI